MRRIVFKILLASLTCLIGLGLTSTWHRFVSRPLSLCEITRDPARYDGRVLRVRGPLYGSPGGVLLLRGAECSIESEAWAEVRLWRGEHAALADELTRLSRGDDYGRAEVVVTGTFEDRGQSCFSALYAISADEVEQLTPASAVNFFEEFDGRR
ncbi:MAG TPA: hypothetical protein VFZ44_02150 [Pyrinomonadaceae bacterium]